jgi:hypothetical protein
MKRVLTQAFTAESTIIMLLTFAILLIDIVPGAADGYRRPYRHHASYVEATPDYSNCREGWWQTLRYGHVRPVWGTWCR